MEQVNGNRAVGLAVADVVRAERCEAEIQAVLEKYRCVLVCEELRHNGQTVSMSILTKAVVDTPRILQG